MGWYSKIDKGLFGGKLPGGYVKPKPTETVTKTPPKITSYSVPPASVPHDFIGPIRPGVIREPAPSSGGGGGSGGSSGGGGSTVPSDFVGPLQPGVTREPAPSPTTRKISTAPETVPSDFVGPLQPGTTREPSPKIIKQQTIKDKFIKTSPTTVFRGGYGYSVAPSEQGSFISGWGSPTGSVSPTIQRIRESTQTLIKGGVPSLIAKTGGAIATGGATAYDWVGQINRDWSAGLKEYDESRKADGGLDSLDIKPIGYSRLTDKQKSNWDEYINETATTQFKESQTYVPTTIRAGGKRLWGETIENPLLVGTTLAASGILSIPTTIAGITSIVSGGDIFVSDFGKFLSRKGKGEETTMTYTEPQFGTPQYDPVTGKIVPIEKTITITKDSKALGVVGGIVQGTGWLMPKSSTEVLIDAAAVKWLPGILKKYTKTGTTGLTGFGGYNIYSATTDPTLSTEEKYGKYVMGGGAIIGAVPGTVTTFRNILARGSDDFINIKTSPLGISEAKIDIAGKAVDYNRELAPSEFSALNILKQDGGDVKLEFIPSRSEVYQGKIEPLRTLSGDINLKETPSFPKVTELQQELLDVAKAEGGVVSGSFAQDTLIKDSRPFLPTSDLDILVKDVGSFKKALTSGKIKDKINWETKTITDSPLGKFDILKVYEKSTRKHIADIDPIKYSEEGFGKMFKAVEVGRKTLSPEDLVMGLQKEGKIKLTELKTKKQLKEEGFLDWDTGKPTGIKGVFLEAEKGFDTPEIFIPSKKQFKRLFPGEKWDITLAHELKHYKQFSEKPPGKIYRFLDEKLPYKLKPSEIGAFAFEKKFAREGFTVEGLKLLPPEVRLTSKVLQSSRELPTAKRAKVVTDIAQLLGKEELAKSPSLLRGYGMTKKQQLEWLGTGDIFATHGGQSIIPRWGGKIKVVGKPGDVFYSTGSPVKTGILYSRKSRAGFGGKVEGTSMVELLNPKAWKNLEFIPKRKDTIVEVGKIGKDFVQPNLGTTEIEVGRKIGKEGFFELDIIKKFKTIVEGETVTVAIAKKSGVGVTAKAKSIKDVFNVKTISIDTPRTRIKTKTAVPSIRFGKASIGTDSIFNAITRGTSAPSSGSLLGDRKTRRDRSIADSIRTPGRGDRTPSPPRIELPTYDPRRDPRRDPRPGPRPRPRPRERDPTPTPPIITGLTLSGGSITSKMKQPQGYIPQAKAKGGKWITLSKQPMTRSSALSRASKAIDHTTSAQFRIKKSRGKVKRQSNIDNYFEVTRSKYRPYKIKRGNKVRLIERFIEKKGTPRIDTMGEKSGLKLSKYVKQKGWMTPVKTKSKRKVFISKSPWLV